MNEVEKLLERQAAWQRTRADLSWTEKLRLAARLRDAALALRPTTPVKRADRAAQPPNRKHRGESGG